MLVVEAAGQDVEVVEEVDEVKEVELIDLEDVVALWILDEEEVELAVNELDEEVVCKFVVELVDERFVTGKEK
ncbi:MAG: hypothetical protein OK422_01855 [Thaumarchaeota archaeon]|nr:hypothetical protein [Nitrososphaerota archaeon]